MSECVGCGDTAITTAAQLPVCGVCFDQYHTEGQQYLPVWRRMFFRSLIDKARAAGIPSASAPYAGY